MTLSLILFFILTACASNNNAQIPSWYVSPAANNSNNLYGVGEGFTLEEATKSALADMASRLMITVSAETTSLSESNNISVNEEFKKSIKANIEKISFTNFEVSKSQKIGQNFYTEVTVKRDEFIKSQKENHEFLQEKISNLTKNSATNPVEKRNNLVKVLDLAKQDELSSRILSGLKADVNLKQTLKNIATWQNQLDKINDKIEFYFEINSKPEIAKVIRSALNKEKIKIATSHEVSQNQVVIRITSDVIANKIYEAYITKLKIDFENLSGSKIIASNAIEVTGSSSIDEKESYRAAITALTGKIKEEGILSILGIN